MNTVGLKTTISISRATKARMDKWRTPGQCYDGFLIQIVNLWEKMHNSNDKRKM
jgi:hypothetical protein